MEKIRIKNLRSLKDTGLIDIKPLTILVGKNSSGKSTFLRFFPLMKQTLSTKRNEPILWYSKQNVDFGSFDESINRESKEKLLSFEFKFKTILANRRREKNVENPLEIFLNLELKEKSIKKVIIKIYDKTITFNAVDDIYKLTINDLNYNIDFRLINPDVYENFIPRFVIKSDEKKDGETTHSIINHINEKIRDLIYEHVLKNETGYSDMESQSKLRKDISDVIRELTLNKMELVANNKKELIDKVEKELNSHVWLIDESEIEFINGELLIADNKNLGDVENELLKYMKNTSLEDYKVLSELLFGCYVNKLIEICNDYLNTYFLNVHYIAPVRASAQRYYRLQGLAVDEIDPMGENIPMAINHLSYQEKERFKSWMKENFGFEIETKNKGGHVTLNISFGKNESLNLADTGFGFSQVLPIILLLWRVENSQTYSRKIMYKNINIHSIVIEQPELHLHPALQARLTDALVDCIEKSKEQGIDLNVIIETHSETIINRVGQLVYKNRIPKEQINVLIFGKLEKQNPSDSCLHSVSYDEEGTIEDWPLGFFYPEV